MIYKANYTSSYTICSRNKFDILYTTHNHREEKVSYINHDLHTKNACYIQSRLSVPLDDDGRAVSRTRRPMLHAVKLARRAASQSEPSLAGEEWRE